MFFENRRFFMCKYSKMAVAFIDILGTTARNSFKEKYAVHEIFHKVFKEEEKRQYNHQGYSTRKVWRFSDCVYIAYFHESEDKCCDEIKLLAGLLENLPISILQLYNKGYLVRGGVAVGDGYFDDNGFFGPVFEKASSFDAKNHPPFIFINNDLAQKLQKRIYDAHSECCIPELMNIIPPVEYCENLPASVVNTSDFPYSIVNVFHSIKKHCDVIWGIGAGDKVFENIKSECDKNFNISNDAAEKWNAFAKYLSSKEDNIKELLSSSAVGIKLR